MARKLKWETAAWSASAAVGDAIMSVSYAGLSYIELVSPQAVEASERDGIWVERIIGQVFWRTYNEGAPDPPYGNIKERISVGHRFDPAVASATDVSDPWEPTQAIDNFLWERTQEVLEGGDLSNGPFSSFGQHPFWSVIDVRVGRWLRPTQFLCYTGAADPQLASVDSRMLCHGWLRVLLSE